MTMPHCEWCSNGEKRQAAGDSAPAPPETQALAEASEEPSDCPEGSSGGAFCCPSLDTAENARRHNRGIAMSDEQRRGSEAILLVGLLAGLWAAASYALWWVVVPLGCALYAAGRLAAGRDSEECDEDDDSGPDPEEDEVMYARGWMSPPAQVKDLDLN